MTEQRSHTDRLASALRAIEIADEALYDGGYTADSTARSNLAIACSLIKEALADDEQVAS